MASFTIDEALETIGFGRFQWMLLALAGLGFCGTTVELIIVPLIKAPMLVQWPHISKFQYSLLSSLTFAGELLGGLLWALISDRFGRRLPWIGTAAMAACVGMLSAFAPCFHALLILRFVLGMAIGSCLAIDFVYFAEFMPASSRRRRTLLIILIGVLGCKASLPASNSLSLLRGWARLALPGAGQLAAAGGRQWAAVRAAAGGPAHVAVGVAALLAEPVPGGRGPPCPAQHGRDQRRQAAHWPSGDEHAGPGAQERHTPLL